MKRVRLDRKDSKIKEFVQSLTGNADGSILELEGKALLKVVPVRDEPVDERKLRAAIRKRRDESRRLNQEWESVDRDMWDRLEGTQE